MALASSEISDLSGASLRRQHRHYARQKPATNPGAEYSLSISQPPSSVRALLELHRSLAKVRRATRLSQFAITARTDPEADHHLRKRLVNDVFL
jgi:hypothetical protein